MPSSRHPTQRASHRQLPPTGPELLAKAVAKVGGQRGWLSDPLDRNGEYISDTTLGLDDSRCTGVAFELASEAKDLHVDTAIEDILMHARGLQQLLTAKWTLRRLEKGKQQCVLALGQD